MSWFKRLFSRNEEPEQALSVELDVSDVLQWYNKRVSESFDSLKSVIKDSYESILSESNDLKKTLEKLKDAELQNPNVPDKVLQIMEGNRKAYINQHILFLESLGIPQEVKYKNTVTFCENFNDVLEKLAQSTGKSHAILDEFFGNHVSQVNMHVKKMKDSAESIRKELTREKDDINFVEDVRDQISDLLKKHKLTQDIIEDIALEKQKLESSKLMKEKLEKREENLKKREEYIEFKRVVEEKDRAVKAVRQVESEINHVFAQLDRPLRKYERIAVEYIKLLQSYLSDPVAAFVIDENFDVIPLMQKIKSALLANTIVLKDDKEREKALSRIDQISPEGLQNLKARLADANNERKKIENKLKHNPVIRQLEDMQYKLNHTKEQMEKTEENIDNLMRRKEKLNIPFIKEKVENNVKSITQVEVLIKLPEEERQEAAEISEESRVTEETEDEDGDGVAEGQDEDDNDFDDDEDDGDDDDNNDPIKPNFDDGDDDGDDDDDDGDDDGDDGDDDGDDDDSDEDDYHDYDKEEKR